VELGDWVQRRYGSGETRVGRLTGRVDEGHDVWCVSATNGSVFRDNGRDLIPMEPPVQPGPLTVFD